MRSDELEVKNKKPKTKSGEQESDEYKKCK